MAITTDINARIEEARKRRSDAAAAADEELKRVYDDILLGLEDDYDNPDVDTKSKFEAVRSFVFGEKPEPSIKEVEVEKIVEVGEKLTDEEQELIKAFRDKRIVKTDKGAYRDREWTKFHPPADKAKDEGEKPEPKPAPKKADSGPAEPVKKDPEKKQPAPVAKADATPAQESQKPLWKRLLDNAKS